MRILRLPLFVLVILAGAFVLFLVYATVEDYRPEARITLHSDTTAAQLPDTVMLKLLIWNIGYAGLDATMDFFYDGGERTMPGKEQSIRNLKGILKTLAPLSGVDFMLLQEVDSSSKRSHYMDHVEIISEHFHTHHAYYAPNYRVSFVPVPLREPLGRVESGLMTLSRYAPVQVVRMDFPGSYGWPVRLFMLDRCFLVCRYPLENGRQLVVINTHNSAYDDGSLKEREMAFLSGFLLDEYRSGNYVIAGGDWNQTPESFTPRWATHRFDTLNASYLDDHFPAPEWTWAYDPGLPTNRRIGSPYHRDSSMTTLIDYYLLSPNIRMEYIKTMDTEFVHSDHQPVLLRARLLDSEDQIDTP